uniref:Uncharacterized protein n=1 Tax=Anguilla anguilla TaxID=7936 RepID=A0A0E9TMB4_ANGAN
MEQKKQFYILFLIFQTADMFCFSTNREI